MPFLKSTMVYCTKDKVQLLDNYIVAVTNLNLRTVKGRVLDDGANCKSVLINYFIDPKHEAQIRDFARTLLSNGSI